MWTVVQVAFQRHTAQPRFGSGSVNISIRSIAFETLRTMIGFRLSTLTENLRQGPGIAFFSIAGQCEPHFYVRVALCVPRAVSSFTDTGTFSVSLGTFFQIRSAPPHGLLQVLWNNLSNVPRRIVVFFQAKQGLTFMTSVLTNWFLTFCCLLFTENIKINPCRRFILKILLSVVAHFREQKRPA